MLRTSCLALICFGVIGFFGVDVLHRFGSPLSKVELPVFFETTTIALPEGGRLAATTHLQRVQRYGRDGTFENGWFVDAKGGIFAIGMTRDNKVAVCTARGKQMLLFELDGQPFGEPGTCVPRFAITSVLQPNDISAGTYDLRPAVVTQRPAPSLITIVAVPFWSPPFAWAMILLGVLGLRSSVVKGDA